MAFPCTHCGQLDTPENRAALEELYWRRKDRRQDNEALVYTSADFDYLYDPDDFDAARLAMERNMAQRGLCPGCGLPNLAGLTEDDFDTPEDAQAMAEIAAERAAEYRAGCG